MVRELTKAANGKAKAAPLDLKQDLPKFALTPGSTLAETHPTIFKKSPKSAEITIEDDGRLAVRLDGKPIKDKKRLIAVIEDIVRGK
ncbi:hypothetical protein R3X27_09725 [Tropicimonas sp. TH_r6]|uniref:hypothetical protein n=1 Tax=Tropicimonas sp. TH_r6 TaxID=3082085 RepID=UPI002952E957|nr:hypothetical protein [Tropicimonas sp. TH_r6]MDV7142964.1 hypothetical protein [Tropicimonas sp. TH_r6]